MPNILSLLPSRILSRHGLSRLGRDQSGATMIEYCIIIACIAIVVVVGYSQIGQFPTRPLETVASFIG
ncbi:MAG TPA: Flp family type IVb pilin [Pedomonas sp.]|uniref:Flp family type IVb pilin n=1 Tax=Pedomonas sp. TaxID=2976421 RepID=UPI002F3E4D76